MGGAFDGPSPAAMMEAGTREMAALADLLAATAPGQSVHGARRRIKQLRSLLRLLRAPLGEVAFKQANEALREAAEALAGHRRAEALVVAAGKLEPEAASGNGFWCGFADAHRTSHAATEDPAHALSAAQSAIARAAGALGATGTKEAAADAVATAFLAAYGKARKLLRKGLDSGDATTLHEARKFVIHHLHQLKLLHPLSERRLAALEALREILGDLNDLDELEQLAAGAAIPEAEARRMHKARRRLLRRARKAAAPLFRNGQAAFGKRMRHAAEARSPRAPVALQAGG